MEGTGRYLGGATPALLLLLGSLGAVGRGAPLPRLRLSYKDLLEWNRTSILYADVGDSGATSSGGSKLWLGALLLDEYHERLFLGTRDALYSLRLDDLGDIRKISWPVAPMQKELCIVQRKDPLTDCSNLVRVLHRFNQTHLLACGTGAFQPICAFIYVGHKAREHKFRLEVQSLESGRGKCPFDTNQPFTSTVAGQQLFTGLFADFFGEDSAILRSSCGEHQQTMRTEHADQHLLHEPRFVYSRLIPETDDPDDDKVYFFFSETTTGSDGRSKARRARVARVCVNDAGGERVLVNKWTTFTKTRLVCSVPGPDGIDTHFDELVDVFVLSERDEKNPIIYGLFSTVSHVFHGFAVCVYRMVDVRDAFSGPYAQQYAGYRHMGASRQEKVPYPRPGFCPSRITSWPGAQLRGTRSYPDAVLHFARVHPLMARAVLPSHGAPVWHSAGPPECLFTSFTVDFVEAADGVYDVIFLGTDCGKVLKVVSINQMESGEPEAIILEEMQIFKTPMPITTMKISVKRGQLFVGSTWGVARVAVSECARYGNKCAECCLARDPYCAWDGMACSTYQSFSRRRFRRQNVRNGDPFIQCLDQNHQGDLASRLPEHLVFGVERNSTLLECQPRSLQASVTWHVQHFHNGRRGQVKTDERVMATELGLLFRSLHRLDSGLYSCHASEHGFSQTVGRYRLEVIANARLEGLMERTGDKKERPFSAVASSRQPCTASPVGRAPVSQPWFKGVMHLLGTSQHLQDFCQNIGCKAAWLRKGRSGRKGSSGKWALGQESKKRRRRHRTRTPRAAKPKQARRLN